MKQAAPPDNGARRGAPQAAAHAPSRRWWRITLWTALGLAATLAALIALERYTGLSERLGLRDRVPPWARLWQDPGTSQPRAHESAQETQPPDAQPAKGTTPERVIIEEPVIIQIPSDPTATAPAADGGIEDAGAAQQRAQVERKKRRSQRSRKAQRRAKHKARQRAERKQREERRKRRNTPRRTGGELEPPPFLDSP